VLLMVIERFRNRNAKAVCSRFREKGRLMPNGVAFIDSWVTADLSRCFQVMECDDITLFAALGRRMVGPDRVRNRSGRAWQGYGRRPVAAVFA